MKTKWREEGGWGAGRVTSGQKGVQQRDKEGSGKGLQGGTVCFEWLPASPGPAGQVPPSLSDSVPSIGLTDLVDEVLEADVAVDPPRDDGGRLRARRLAAHLVLHVGRHRTHLRRDEPRLHWPH